MSQDRRPYILRGSGTPTTSSEQPSDAVAKGSMKQRIQPIRKMTLIPAGYALRSEEDDLSTVLTTDDPQLFEAYARSQWAGKHARVGDYLMDTAMYPDFAFKIIEMEPEEGLITEDTRIEVIFQPSAELSKTTLGWRPTRNISFDDIIGQEVAKKKCRVIIKFLQNDEWKQSEWMPRNILFYGPPGTGKTMMAMALANSIKATFFAMKASDLLGLYVGDGSRRIHRLFAEARANAPSVIFIDELDAIALARQYQNIRGDVVELVAALLSELDGVQENKDVILIAATNAVDILDPAVKSRFEQMIPFSLPSLEERKAILMKYSRTSPIPFKAVNWNEIARMTENWSGRDLKEKLLKNLIHDAVLESKDKITHADVVIKIKDILNTDKKSLQYVD